MFLDSPFQPDANVNSAIKEAQTKRVPLLVALHREEDAASAALDVAWSVTLREFVAGQWVALRLTEARPDSQYFSPLALKLVSLSRGDFGSRSATSGERVDESEAPAPHSGWARASRGVKSETDARAYYSYRTSSSTADKTTKTPQRRTR